MDLGLVGRVIVITGGGAGIGRACVEAFMKEGAHIVAGDIALDGLRDVKGPGTLTPHAVDLLAPEGPAELVKVAEKEFGTVDCVVNNIGGAAVRESFLDVDDQAWSAMLNKNMMVMVRTCRAALPHMLAKKRGAIVNLASTSGRQPDAYMVDYCAAKSAVLSITKSISIEFGPHGIRANSVSPGTTRTPAVLRSIGTVMAEKWGLGTEDALSYHAREFHRMPLGRVGEPADVAAVVLFLASDAARQVTGAEYVVDGGLLKAH
jgi:NAD(P)-dependent dehydrogenase (short-subunit alcohol dehydrogenase family)